MLVHPNGSVKVSVRWPLASITVVTRSPHMQQQAAKAMDDALGG